MESVWSLGRACVEYQGDQGDQEATAATILVKWGSVEVLAVLVLLVVQDDARNCLLLAQNVLEVGIFCLYLYDATYLDIILPQCHVAVLILIEREDCVLQILRSGNLNCRVTQARYLNSSWCCFAKGPSEDCAGPIFGVAQPGSYNSLVATPLIVLRSKPGYRVYGSMYRSQHTGIQFQHVQSVYPLC